MASCTVRVDGLLYPLLWLMTLWSTLNAARTSLQKSSSPATSSALRPRVAAAAAETRGMASSWKVAAAAAASWNKFRRFMAEMLQEAARQSKRQAVPGKELSFVVK